MIISAAFIYLRRACDLSDGLRFGGWRRMVGALTRYSRVNSKKRLVLRHRRVLAAL